MPHAQIKAANAGVTIFHTSLEPTFVLGSPFNQTRYSLAASTVLAVVSLVLLCLTYL